MFDTLFNAGASLLGTKKDDLIARALKPAINAYLDGTGTAESLVIDSTSKTADVTLAMVGEERPVIVRIERYSIERDPAGCALIVHDFSSPSHQWIATVAKKISPEIRIPIALPFAAVSTIV